MSYCENGVIHPKIFLLGACHRMEKLTKRRVLLVFMGVLLFLVLTYIHLPVSISQRDTFQVIPQPSGTEHHSVHIIQNPSAEHLPDGSANQTWRRVNEEPLKKLGMDRDLEVGLPWWDGVECICDKGSQCPTKKASLENSFPTEVPDDILGTCSRRASADGFNQRVISFSLYGRDAGYWTGLNETLTNVKIWYPGWKAWLYTDPRGMGKILCPLLREHDHLRVCDVTNLPPPLRDLSKVNPRVWRMAPLGDPTVDILAVRDSDSKFTERERSAVQEWLDSGKMFHVMRDNPGHAIQILAGMWGARWDTPPHTPPRDDSAQLDKKDSSLHRLIAQDLLKIRNRMFKLAYKNGKSDSDQAILKRILWPKIVKSVISHDSFYCKVYPVGWRPWPTQRLNGTFVGNANYREEFANNRMKKECPPECRPQNHPDWLYC